MVDLWRAEPLHEQLAAILRAQIDKGELQPGQRLPSELALQQTYDLARGTVRRALKLLRDEGKIVTYLGRGSFVPPAQGRHGAPPTA